MLQEQQNILEGNSWRSEVRAQEILQEQEHLLHIQEPSGFDLLKVPFIPNNDIMTMFYFFGFGMTQLYRAYA